MNNKAFDSSKTPVSNYAACIIHYSIFKFLHNVLPSFQLVRIRKFGFSDHLTVTGSELYPLGRYNCFLIIALSSASTTFSSLALGTPL